jgi:hypothetical protein
MANNLVSLKLRIFTINVMVSLCYKIFPFILCNFRALKPMNN